MLQTEADGKCRLCQQFDETPHNIGLLNIGKTTRHTVT
jgi:hypothetical protein